MADAVSRRTARGSLPRETPYSSGFLGVRDMMVPGAILAFSSWAAFNVVARFVWPLLGIGV